MQFTLAIIILLFGAAAAIAIIEAVKYFKEEKKIKEEKINKEKGEEE